MIKYLNADSRNYVALTWQFIGAFEKQEKAIAGKKKIDEQDKELLKYLRTALAYLRKYINTWMRELDEKEEIKINRIIETTGILFTDKYKARQQLKEWDTQEKEDTIEVSKWMIEDLLDRLISQEKSCKGCKRTDSYDCKLKEVLERWDTPATTENPIHCKYEF